MNKIWLISFLVVVVLFTSSCRDEFTICNLSKEVKFNAGLYEKNTVGDIAKLAPSLTINALGDTAIINGLANLQVFSLPLNNLVDTAKYVISVSYNKPKDTIKIIYTSQSVLLSVNCGNIINYNISKILFSKNTLDTVKILNPTVSNGLLQNAKLYF